MSHEPLRNDRRRVLKIMAAVSAVASLGQPSISRADPLPEVRRIRLLRSHGICIAPQIVAESLLRSEGFEEVTYVDFRGDAQYPSPSWMLADNKVDVTLDAIGTAITSIDAGRPVTMLAGLHLGCYELFANERVASVHDLKGKVIPINAFGGVQHTFLSSILAYVGLDPRHDVRWEVHPSQESMSLLRNAKVDAFLAFPPEPQQLRANGVSRTILNTGRDKPWSWYYCCCLLANKEFASEYPVATKRATRAILKAADLCSRDPGLAAQYVMQSGLNSDYATVLDTLKDINYRQWRSYNPESTIRFHSVRLHEFGIVKSTPQRIIDIGTDWRILNELRRELKS